MKTNKISENLHENFWVSMQITYYNMAVELEHLQQFEQAIDSFEMAKSISAIHLNNQN